MAEENSTAPLLAIHVPARLTFAGLVGGLIVGLVLRGSDSGVLAPIVAVAEAIGSLWLRALQMTIVPLVAALLFTGIVRTVAAAQAGAMARRTLGLFAAILAAGSVLAVVAMPLLLQVAPIPAKAVAALGGMAAEPPGPVPGLVDFVSSLIPANIVAAAAGDAMVPLIVFIALFALATTRLAEAPRRQLALLFEGLGGAMIVVIGWVLMLAPIGVFALALAVAANSGGAAIGALVHYIVLVSAMGLAVLIGAYLLAVTAAGRRLRDFAGAVLPAQAVALSTQSSLASLPAMIAACRQLNVRETSADFVLPLAVALFRATSPAMNLAVVIYAAALTGIELTPIAFAAGLGVALLTTIGSVSLPGTISFIASTGPVAIALGVPLEPLALLVAVEMLPDLVRTVGNVTMNVAVTATVDRRETP